MKTFYLGPEEAAIRQVFDRLASAWKQIINPKPSPWKGLSVLEQAAEKFATFKPVSDLALN